MTRACAKQARIWHQEDANRGSSEARTAAAAEPAQWPACSAGRRWPWRKGPGSFAAQAEAGKRGLRRSTAAVPRRRAAGPRPGRRCAATPSSPSGGALERRPRAISTPTSTPTCRPGRRAEIPDETHAALGRLHPTAKNPKRAGAAGARRGHARLLGAAGADARLAVGARRARPPAAASRRSPIRWRPSRPGDRQRCWPIRPRRNGPARRRSHRPVLSPLSQIDTSNVGQLRIAWAAAAPAGVNMNEPLVHNGVLYVFPATATRCHVRYAR